MKILIIGGTQFVGRHIARAVLDAGHELTLFHRGQHGAELFPEAERLHGDRETDLSVLAGRTWDAVVDTCGYVPRVVEKSAAVLRGRVGKYVFISTISVYADFTKKGLTENDAVATIEDKTNEDIQKHYGALKALCEETVEQYFSGSALHIRPGLIVGAFDPTGRFSYWPHRVARGGDVLAPAPADQRVQFIDAVDLAGWTIKAIENDTTGKFNAAGPAEPCTLERLLERCRHELNPSAKIRWVNEEVLTANNVQFFAELPLCFSASKQPEFAGFAYVDASKAIAAGLTFRPLERTVRDAFEFSEVTDQHPVLRSDREAELLALG